MDKWLVGSYILFLIWFQTYSATVAGAQLKRGESVETIVLGEVVRAEIAALRLADRKDLCVAINGKNASGDLVRLLRASGVVFHKASWCSKGPRGIGIEVRSVTLAGDRGAQVHIATGDHSLREGEHFGTLLREGTYILERRADGTWGIVDYKKVCCPTKE